MRKQTLIIIGLIVLAIAVRLIIVANTYVISSDGPVYIQVAQDYYNGNYQEALNHPYHPLYPFLMSLVYRIVGSWEWAGLLISILFASLAIIPLYHIANRFFPQIVVWLTCLLYILHPQAARLGASVLTTGLFIFLLLYTVWWAILAVVDYNRRYLLLTGIGSILIYLTRPDGVLVLVTVVLVIVFGKLPRQILNKTRTAKPPAWLSPISITHRGLALSVLVLPWLIAAIPYMYHIYKTTGKFEITQKFSISRIENILDPPEQTPGQARPNPARQGHSGGDRQVGQAGLSAVRTAQAGGVAETEDKSTLTRSSGYFSSNGAEDETISESSNPKPETRNPKLVAPVYRHLNSAWMLTVDFIQGAHPLLFLLLIVGILYYRMPDDTTERYKSWLVWLVLAVYLVALFKFAYIFGRMSRRYPVPLAVLVLPWSAAGLYYLWNLISQRVSNIRYHIILVACLLTFVTVILILALSTFKPVGKDKLGEKQVGDWIRQDSNDLKPVVISGSNRIAYYAGGRAVPLTQTIPPRDAAWLSPFEDTEAVYLVLDNKTPDAEETLFNILGERDAEPVYLSAPTAVGTQAGREPALPKTYNVYRLPSD
ncbi:MAG: glycosyltransferase family 39 protein [Planctomycetes bacterium]|nr:glycosyltransferase family 39 protein [Planctomycetota bacterium]